MGDDKCMGSLKIRTISLCAILAVYSILSLIVNFEHFDNATSDFYKVLGIALLMTAVVSVIIIILNLLTVPPIVGKIFGVALIVAAIMIFVAACIQLNDQKKVLDGLKKLQELADKNPIFKADLGVDKYEAGMAKEFIKLFLPAGIAIFVGVDYGLGCCDKESFRLFFNLGLLAFVTSVLLTTSYIMSGKGTEEQSIEGIGYTVIFVSCIVYIILYLLTCCTCNCKDSKFVRWGIAIALVVGAVLAAIGIYSGSKHQSADQVLSLIGYTVLLLGDTVIWAIDIFSDDKA